jgi:hypothetical protein
MAHGHASTEHALLLAQLAQTCSNTSLALPDQRLPHGALLEAPLQPFRRSHLGWQERIGKSAMG